MPANSTAFFPSLSGGINKFNGEEEDFGDFVFSSTPSSHTPSFFPFRTSDEEEWGDFIAGDLQSSSQNERESRRRGRKRKKKRRLEEEEEEEEEGERGRGRGRRGNPWVKSKGVIPLSVFGEEEEEEEEIDLVKNERESRRMKGAEQRGWLKERISLISH